MINEYYPHPILDLTSEELMKLTLDKILEANPGLKIGEAASDWSQVWDGKAVPTHLPADLNVSLDFKVPHVARPFVQAQSQPEQKIYFQDPNGFDFFKRLPPGYIHPQMCHIPRAKMLKLHKPGDVVNLRDDNYEVSPYTLTQNDFNNHAYVYFAFAYSPLSPQPDNIKTCSSSS